MKMRTAAVAIALVVAACSPATPGGSPDPADETTTSSPTEATIQPPNTGAESDVQDIDPDNLGLVILAGPGGEFASDLLVGCDGHRLMPLGALDQISTITDDDPDGYLAAIEPFLAGGEGQFWPQEGWQLLWANDTQASLVTKTAEGSLAWMYLTRNGSDWSWSGSSIDGDPCELRASVPEGMNTVEWRLDPDFGEPDSESTEIHLLLNERECVGGEALGDRLLGPQVVLTEGEIRVVFVAEAPPGETFTCPGNPDTPFVLELPEPLGDRQLVDGFGVGITLDDYVD